MNFWSILGTILNKNIDMLKNYENVIIVDPIYELTNSRDNFTDYIHLTSKGNKILANKIYQSIKN
jgi:lysophospholipase L1-like esterase